MALRELNGCTRAGRCISDVSGVSQLEYKNYFKNYNFISHGERKVRVVTDMSPKAIVYHVTMQFLFWVNLYRQAVEIKADIKFTNTSTFMH